MTIDFVHSAQPHEAIDCESFCFSYNRNLNPVLLACCGLNDSVNPAYV